MLDVIRALGVIRVTERESGVVDIEVALPSEEAIGRHLHDVLQGRRRITRAHALRARAPSFGALANSTQEEVTAMSRSAATEGEGIDRLVSWLRQRGIEHRVVEHDPMPTAGADARAVDVPLEHTAKTVVLHDGPDYCLVVVAASDRVDLRKVRELLDRPYLRLATEDEMAQRFPDCEVGAVPPLGPDVPPLEVIDARLLDYNRLLCSGGDHRHAVLVDASALVDVAGARVADVRED